MSVLRRFTFVAVLAALLASLAFGVGWASAADRLPWAGTEDGPTRAADDRGGPATAPGRDQDGDRDRVREDRGVVPPAEEEPSPSEATDPPIQVEKKPDLVPGPRLLGPGDSGDEVRDLQARLAQIDWFEEDVTGFYGDITEQAVRGFQAKREIPVTGEVDQRTMDRLDAMTTEPTEAELTNQTTTNTPGALDPRCTTGRALCVDKSTRTLRWVVDGRVVKTVDVRFGSEYTPTREGAFTVESKSRDHVSSLFDTPMPFAMFFSGGQAVHYSADFAAVGYNGASHGCVNVRDYDAVAWLFDQVQVGDTVIVYWS